MDCHRSYCKNLIFLHTNDLHSRLDQASYLDSMIQEQRRMHAEDELFVIDCGDHMDRMRMETEGSDGLVNIEILNASGYDFVTIGNNEGLTFLPSTLEQWYKEKAKFKVLVANMFEMSTGKHPSWALPFHIEHRGGLKVAFIGMTVDFTTFYQLLGWEMKDPFEITKQTVKHLRPQADVIVLISHLGILQDRKIAEEIEGIDVILGAHTHHLLMEGERINQTLLAATGKFGQYVGKVTVQYEQETKTILSSKAECFSVQDRKPSPKIDDIMQRYKQISREKLGQSIAYVERDIDLSWSSESTLGNLAAAGLRRWTGAQIGIVNSGQMIHGFRQGHITREMLLEICPSPVNPCMMRLSGKDIRIALEQSLQTKYQRMMIRGFGFRGEVLGNLAVDGLRITCDMKRSPGSQIIQVDVRGEDGYEPLLNDKEYWVGSIDMFTFGIGYLSLKDGKDVQYFLPEFLRDVLQAQLNLPEELEAARMQRWQMEPF